MSALAQSGVRTLAGSTPQQNQHHHNGKKSHAGRSDVTDTYKQSSNHATGDGTATATATAIGSEHTTRGQFSREFPAEIAGENASVDVDPEAAECLRALEKIEALLERSRADGGFFLFPLLCFFWCDLCVMSLRVFFTNVR